MTEQRPEVVAAALALARDFGAFDDACRLHGAGGVTVGKDCDSEAGRARAIVRASLLAYRAAIAPRRTRAEVDAERLLNLDAFRANVLSGTELCMRDSILCREETAPEPSSMDRAFGAIPDCPLGDPDPCSCDEAEALKERISQALAHLEHRESYGRTDEYVRMAVGILKR